MSKIINKELTNGECYAIVTWYLKQLDKKEDGQDNILDKFSNLFLWKLRRNINAIESTAIAFDDFKTEVSQKIIEKWLSGDKSHEITVPLKDDNGNDVTDGHGNVLTRQTRQVKDEYLDDFNKELEKANKEIKEILCEKSEYKISVINVEDEIESILDQVDKSDFDDLEILLFMNEE